MLFCDPDVEAPLREPLVEQIQPGPASHGRVYGNDALVSLRLGDQGLGKVRCVGLGGGAGLELLPSCRIKLSYACKE